jgi:hypothetical protein
LGVRAQSPAADKTPQNQALFAGADDAIAYCPCGIFRPLLNPHARWVPEIGYVLRSSPDRKEALDHDHGVWGNCSELIAEVPEAHRRKPMLCFIGFARGQLSHIARAEARMRPGPLPSAPPRESWCRSKC